MEVNYVVSNELCFRYKKCFNKITYYFQLFYFFILAVAKNITYIMLKITHITFNNLDVGPKYNFPNNFFQCALA